MDGVSGAFAVVSLAIQLVETGEKISKFLSSVQDAPSEVTKLAQTLDLLNGTLKQVSYLLEQQYLVHRLPGSPVFITNALENCENRIRKLEGAVHKAKKSTDHGNQMQRSWAAMRFVSKKEDIQEMQNQLRDAQAGLQTAIMSNSWQLQMHSISIAKHGGLQATTIQESSLVPPTRSVPGSESLQNSSSTPKSTLCTTTKETNLVWYRGFFGSVNIQSKSKFLSSSNTRRAEVKAITEEKIVTITSMYLCRTLELRFVNSFGSIPRTLNIYTVLEDNAPIFSACRIGDLQGLQVALSSGSVSPFVQDEFGSTLLHYAAKYVELCALLLQLGVDPNRMDVVGYKAMNSIYARFGFDRGKSTDTLRLLTQSQADITPQDMSVFWDWYGGPVEGAEFMFSQYSIQSEFDLSESEYFYPPLAGALREFRRESSEWENFVRLLLRKGADLHSPVSRRYTYSMGIFDEEISPTHPCKLLEYGTPLDELFSLTYSPFEGETAADRWLQILLSEGYDVKAYLEEEQALHATQMQFTISFQEEGTHTPRQLIYHWGNNPSVTWDWWIDPESSTYLVRKEYKLMATTPHFLHTSWEVKWPFDYPAWSDHFRHFVDEISFPEWQSLNKRAQERATRRMEKKATKAARAQGLKTRNQMPGAWPL